jgi:threonine synthase
VIIPGGNLGNTGALGAGFLMMKDLSLIQQLPRIIVAQAERANPLYRSFKRGLDRLEPLAAGSTLATAIQIGNPVSYEKAARVIRRFDGLVEQASEDELAQAAARADRGGLFTDPHTGVALAVLEKLAARGTISRSDRTVVISSANGLKFPDFKVKYHQGALAGVADRFANRPVELPNEYETIKRAALGAVAARM